MLQLLKEEMPSLLDDSEDTWSKLLEAIKRERVLLVLDDLRSVSQEQFDHLLYCLQGDGAQISVLVTTRRIETATTINASYTHNLQGLSDADSWDLFRNVISHPIVLELETVGRQIVRKCHGVPRVIQKMASLLQNIEDISKWEIMEKGELLDLSSFTIMSTLSLTYDCLPKALKLCFAYCCIFPKDAIIRKNDLIRLWLAQGFLPEVTLKSSIETGEKFFDILLYESFLQVREYDEDGNFVECTMHHLAHDLAMYISRHDVSIKDDQRNRPCNQSDVRHLVISSGKMTEAMTTNFHYTRLRTIYSIGAVRESLLNPMVAKLETLLSQARYLYVLILDGNGLKEVPKSLQKLKYLRYLDLSNNPLKHIPESIAHLYLLQTLLFRNCDKLENTEKPPKGIGNLTYLSLAEASLKQLNLDSDFTMQPPVKLDENWGSVTVSELHDVTDIAGLLCISGLELVMDKNAAQKARIGKKHSLSALELHWSRERPEASNSQHNQDEDVLNGLEPHSNIRRLKLINYDGDRFPMWMMNMKGRDNERLWRLVKIELVDCKRCLKVPTMGQLPYLQSLFIAGMDNIEGIGDELYKYADDSEDRDALKLYFPALKRLELRDLRGIKEWQSAPTYDKMYCRAFLNLEKLQIVNCPNLTRIPSAFPCMKSLLIQGVRSCHSLNEIITTSCANQTLTSLVLYKVTNLTLPQELFLCTSLEELRLLKCQEFKLWPANMWKLSSLKELCIDGCSLYYVPRIDSLTALNTLVIRGCGNLGEVPPKLEHCISLAKLAISDCERLEEIPDLQMLTNLEELDILDCVKVRSLPAGLHDLPNLRILRVGGLSNNFDQFPECRFLETLWITGLPDTAYLPHQLKVLTQLKVLRVRKFGTLRVVPKWICKMKDLETLIFEECHMLENFPPKEDMLNLIKLWCLRIENCAALENISDREWKNISHVQHIKIRGDWVQGDRSFLLQEIPSVGELVQQTVDGPDDEQVEQAFGGAATTFGGRSSLGFYFTIMCVLLSIIIASLKLY